MNDLINPPLLVRHSLHNGYFITGSNKYIYESTTRDDPRAKYGLRACVDFKINPACNFLHYYEVFAVFLYMNNQYLGDFDLKSKDLQERTLFRFNVFMRDLQHFESHKNEFDFSIVFYMNRGLFDLHRSLGFFNSYTSNSAFSLMWRYDMLLSQQLQLQLPTGDTSVCGICLEPMRVSSRTVHMFDCGHAIHNECITPVTWQTYNYDARLQLHYKLISCPYCREKHPIAMRDTDADLVSYLQASDVRHEDEGEDDELVDEIFLELLRLVNAELNVR